jgi:hypothetical protein
MVMRSGFQIDAARTPTAELGALGTIGGTVTGLGEGRRDHSDQGHARLPVHARALAEVMPVIFVPSRDESLGAECCDFILHVSAFLKQNHIFMN